MVFVAGGILASTDVLGWLDPTIRSESVRWVAEATLAVVLFSDASRIDLAALRREYVVPVRLLAIGLPLTIVAGTPPGGGVVGDPPPPQGPPPSVRPAPPPPPPRPPGGPRPPGP